MLELKVRKKMMNERWTTRRRRRIEGKMARKTYSILRVYHNYPH